MSESTMFNIDILLQELFESSKDFYKSADPLLLWFFLQGMGLGSVLLVVLTFVPGKPSLKGVIDHQGSTSDGSKDDGSKKHTPGKSNKAWDGDQIPPDQLEVIRKRFRLTEAQMEQVLQNAKKEADGGSIIANDWTPHQKLNAMVYIIIIALLVFVLNRDYGNIVTFWFVRWFPKEATTLGIRIGQ
jgi:hypothetical protein